MEVTLNDIMFEDEQLNWDGTKKKKVVIGSHIMDKLLEENNPFTTTSFWIGFGNSPFCRNITDSQFSRFAHRLKSYRVLTEISFRGVSLNKKRMSELCDSLHFMPKIEKISFVGILISNIYTYILDCNMDDDMLFHLSKVINNYTELKELYIYETWYDISAENISKNMRLLHLSPYMELIYAGSELTNRGMKYLFDSLINCKKLQILAIAGNVVNSENGIIDKLIDSLSEMSDISTLGLILKGLDTVGLKKISNVLPQLNQLKSLIINAGHCEEEACISLSDNIAKCTQLINLFLDIPSFGYKPADRLGEAFIKLKSLESFYLNTFKLNDMGFRHMMYSLPELVELNTLILLLDDVGDGGISGLGKVIAYNVSDEGVCVLGENMITNINLKSFTLDSPLVSDRGLRSISKGLSLCRQLQMFSLISEEVTDNGITVLTETLEKCSLQVLYIDCPKLTDTSCELLIKVLENSKNEVCGIGLRIPHMGYKLIKKLLLQMPNKWSKLNQIDIMSEHFDDSLCEILGNSLTQMKEIEYFTLAGNLIGDEGSAIVTNCLIHHPIRTFCINGAEMSDKCVEPLLNCIVKWPRLLAIMLHGNYTMSAYKRLQNGLKKCPLLHRSDVTSDHYSVVHPSLCCIM